MLHIVLGVATDGETDGVRMLRHILRRYSIFTDYRFEYCYTEKPPSKVADRKELIEQAKRNLESYWIEQSGVIVGLGWMPCEVLLGKGKTKLKNFVGTKWTYVGDSARHVWISYDPAGILYDPGLVVDISAVIVVAAKEAGFPTKVNTDDTLAYMDKIWRRYL
jgi:hypothetical protein